MVRLQTLPLEEAKPDLDLIEPGSIGRQPQHLKMQTKIAHATQLLEPAFELPGGMRRPIIENEDDRLNVTVQGFSKDDLLHNALEIDKALALAASTVDPAISDGKPGKQVPRATTMIACLVENRFVRIGGTRGLFPLTRLNGGFFIQTHQPRAVLRESACLKVSVENRTGALQEGFWMMDVLPRVIAPGTKAFRFEPATHRTRRETRQARIVSNLSRQGTATPAGERDGLLPRQATSEGSDLRADLRGKNASVLHSEEHQLANAFLSSVRASYAPFGRWSQRSTRSAGCFAQDVHLRRE